ncbi:MAG TPA: hypothetical protein VFG71_03425 [Nitrospiraceae bacterium]|nr:hypothetical protein [Nitrospiraceae bacterium]
MVKNRKRPRRRGNASLGLHLTAERSPPGKPASLGSLPRFCSSFLMALVLVCTGCALTTGYSEQRTTQSNERRCSPTPIDKQLRAVSLEEVDRAQSDPQVKAAQARLPTSFSWRAIQTARTIDILPLLSQIELTEESPTSDPSAPLKLLSLRQEALGRILLALIAVSSTVAHVSCEIERTYEVADRLKNAENARVKQQTLLAVIIGAGAAIASGGFSIAAAPPSGEGIASIIGGTIAGALGLSALYQESDQDFEHQDNILREVWDNPAHPNYIAPSVWEFLKRPMKDEAGSRSFRQELVDGWRQEGRLGSEGSKEEKERIALLFSDGGLYRSSDLIVRGQMLDMLRASVSLMNQDLELLIRELMIRIALRKESRQQGGKQE